MLFRTHVVFALAVYFFLLKYLYVPNKILLLFFMMLAMAFVDIDIKNSKFGDHWYLRPLQIFVRHRGITHSLFFAVLLSLVIGGFNLWAGFGFFSGYISHLFLGALTLRGVGLFWPIRWKVRGFVRSGGIAEEVIFVLLLLGNIFVVGRLVFYYLF